MTILQLVQTESLQLKENAHLTLTEKESLAFLTGVGIFVTIYGLIGATAYFFHKYFWKYLFEQSMREFRQAKRKFRMGGHRFKSNLGKIAFQKEMARIKEDDTTEGPTEEEFKKLMEAKMHEIRKMNFGDAIEELKVLLKDPSKNAPKKPFSIVKCLDNLLYVIRGTPWATTKTNQLDFSEKRFIESGIDAHAAHNEKELKKQCKNLKKHKEKIRVYVKAKSKAKEFFKAVTNKVTTVRNAVTKKVTKVKDYVKAKSTNLRSMFPWSKKTVSKTAQTNQKEKDDLEKTIANDDLEKTIAEAQRVTTVLEEQTEKAQKILDSQ